MRIKLTIAFLSVGALALALRGNTLEAAILISAASITDAINTN